MLVSYKIMYEPFPFPCIAPNAPLFQLKANASCTTLIHRSLAEDCLEENTYTLYPVFKRPKTLIYHARQGQHQLQQSTAPRAKCLHRVLGIVALPSRILQTLRNMKGISGDSMHFTVTPRGGVWHHIYWYLGCL